MGARTRKATDLKDSGSDIIKDNGRMAKQTTAAIEDERGWLNVDGRNVIIIRGWLATGRRLGPSVSGVSVSSSLRLDVSAPGPKGYSGNGEQV